MPTTGPVALQRMACGLGWQATLAGDGLAAVQAMSERYDAVLLDQALGRAPRWNAR
jgi:DNA-binding response OmpR family regulator